MAEKAKDQEVLETIVQSIVSNPDEVSVERAVDEMGVLLTLKIDPNDMGSLIGKRGQTIQAIRTLLKIVGAKNNARVNLKIYDPNEGENQSGNQEGSGQEQASSDDSSLEDLNI